MNLKKLEKIMNKKMYDSIYGTWQVTTEGDVEGRSTKFLGTFTGYVDEIALYLAKKCYYSLQFKKIEPVEFKPTKNEVHVMFDIETGTWDMGQMERTKMMQDFFVVRPVHIKKSNYYGSFVISTTGETEEDEKQTALNKLTEREKKLLGVK